MYVTEDGRSTQLPIHKLSAVHNLGFEMGSKRADVFGTLPGRVAKHDRGGTSANFG